MEHSEAEADMVHQKVRAILRGLDGQHSTLQSDHGMLRWTLHRSLDRNPSSCSILVGVLIKELEKAEKADNKHYIIPLLHTLMYAITKAAYIPDHLYERVYVFCKKMLTLPKPYCTIGLDYAQRLKTERKVPGFSYQKMVISEQNLSRGVSQQQDKVFLFLDPDLVSEAVCNTLLRETQGVQISQTPRECMGFVITNSIQAALGKDCDIPRLQRALQDEPNGELELYFQEVLAAVERGEKQSGGGVARELHREALREIYSKITGSPEEEVPMPKLQAIPLPSPDISVHLWTDEDQLWKELVLFTRETQEVEVEVDSFGIPGLGSENTEQNRISVWSNDSGIERDLPGTEEKEQAKLQRQPCIKKRGPELDSAVLLQNLGKAPKGPGTLQRQSGLSMDVRSCPERLPTARIVILGDDRALGRLAKAYYSFRKREARRPHRTLKANLQFYCIPVRGEQPDPSPDKLDEPPNIREVCELSGYLGRLDPWYDGNINTLCDMIPKLADMPPCPTRDSTSDPFILDVTSYYLRFGRQPVYFQIYSVKIYFRDASLEPAEDVFLTELKVDVQDCVSTKYSNLTRKKTVTDAPGAGIQVHYNKALASGREKESTLVLRTSRVVIKAVPPRDAEDLVCLNVYIDEMTKSTHLAGRSFSCKTNALRASSVQMRSLELRTLSLQLDKDSRRVYTNVSRLEVSPCQEPGYSLQKMRASRLHPDSKEDAGLTRYMTKCLLLPINTFAGIIQ